MKKGTFIKLFFFFVLFMIWMVLSPVAFYGEFNKVHEEISPGGKYKVVAYTVLPTTPISLYQSMINNDVFLVLFDASGNYLGQSSPFHFSDAEGIFADEVFFPEDIESNASFSINGINDYAQGYTIPVKQKKWWSRVLTFLH